MTRNSGKSSSTFRWWNSARSRVRKGLTSLARLCLPLPVFRQFRHRLFKADRDAGTERPIAVSKLDTYVPSPEELTLWAEFVGSVTNLHEHEDPEVNSHREAMLFHAAQPNHYVEHYRVKLWQRFMYPIHTARFSRHMRQLKAESGDTRRSRELTKLVDDDLAYIEFAGKSLSPLQRFRTRREIIRMRQSPWKVRSAFISASVVARRGRISVHPVPGRVYWPFRILREALIAAVVWSIMVSIWETATRGCLTCNSLGLLYLSVFLMLFGYFAHIAGPERRQAERFLAVVNTIEIDNS